MKFPKPKVAISKCIEFDSCRWNGNIIKSPIVKVLNSHLNFQPICPEVEIKLGIPRNPVRVVLEDEDIVMIQPSTKINYTDKMNNFSNNFLNSLTEIDGFLLKAQSPSCGLFHTKHYQSISKRAAVLERGPGIFGKKVLNEFPNKAIKTEKRLTNFRIREHWLIKLYTLARFRAVKFSNSITELINFHATNKFLFMAYNQSLMREMGRLIG